MRVGSAFDAWTAFVYEMRRLRHIVERLASFELGSYFGRWCDFVQASVADQDAAAVASLHEDNLTTAQSQVTQLSTKLATTQAIVADHRHAWKIAATLRWSGRHGHMADINSPERLETSLVAAKAFSCWRDHIYTAIRLRELADAQLTGMTWGIARLQGELATSKEDLQQAHRRAATLQEEREVASAALAVSLRVSGIEAALGTPRTERAAAAPENPQHNPSMKAMVDASELRSEEVQPRLFEEGVPPLPSTPPDRPPMRGHRRALHRTPPQPPRRGLSTRKKSSSSSSPRKHHTGKATAGGKGRSPPIRHAVQHLAASPQTPSPRLKPATRQEFDDARRSLTQTVSGSPIAAETARRENSIIGGAPLSRESSKVSPRSVFQSRRSLSRSNSNGGSDAGGGSGATAAGKRQHGAAAMQPSAGSGGQSSAAANSGSPLSLAPVSRSLEPELGLAVEFETALASARVLLGAGGEQEGREKAEREARFERLLEEQKQKDLAFSEQFSAGLQFDPATPSQPQPQPQHAGTKATKPVPFVDVAQQQQQDIDRFSELLAAQQEDLNAIRNSLSPPVAVAVAVADPPTPTATPLTLTLEEIEAQQKAAQVARFEAMLAAEQRRLEGADH